MSFVKKIKEAFTLPFDSKSFRKDLGFTNKKDLKKHYKSTDIVSINWDKIERCNTRLKEIFASLNETVHPSIRWENIGIIYDEIDNAYNTIKSNGIFPRLNNNGRYPEDVYYNWMRGYIACKFFTPALALVFSISESSIRTVGHDSLSKVETFSKSPVADLEITLDKKIVRLEIQSGYTDVNDIKKHKVQEAKRAFLDEDVLSYVVHFDLFNGTVAIVNITNIDDANTHWETRTQMEGKLVFAIPDEAFKWFLPEAPPHYSDILFLP